MATVSEIVAELHTIAGMIAARGMTIGAHEGTRLQSKMVTQLARKVSHLSALSASDSKHMLESLPSSGLSPSDKDTIIAAIDNKLEQQIDDTPEKPASKHNQLNKHPSSYLTPAMITSLSNPSTMIDTKMVVLAEYMVSIGIIHPHEQTYRWWLAITLLLHYKDNLPTYTSIFALLNELKSNVEVARCTPPFALLHRYPAMPHELPEAILTRMFPNDQPVVTHVPRLVLTAKHHIPLRKNAKLITEEKANRRSSPPALMPVLEHHQPLQPPIAASEPPPWAARLLALMDKPQTPPAEQPSRVDADARAYMSKRAADNAGPPRLQLRSEKLNAAAVKHDAACSDDESEGRGALSDTEGGATAVKASKKKMKREPSESQTSSDDEAPPPAKKTKAMPKKAGVAASDRADVDAYEREMKAAAARIASVKKKPAAAKRFAFFPPPWFQVTKSITEIQTILT